MNKATENVINSPSSYLPSLSDVGFRWVIQPDWLEMQQQFYLNNRQYENMLAFKAASFSKHPNHLKPLMKWVLCPNDSDTPIGWAECQGLFTHLSTVFLNVEMTKEETFYPQPILVEALGLLIAAISISCTPDVIKLMAPTDIKLNPISELNWGTLTSVWTPQQNELLMPRINRAHITHLLTIDCWEWRESRYGMKYREKLSYLEKRKAKLDAQASCGCEKQPKKRGWIAKILRPKV
ncbi:MAG: hypothetical protein R3B45_07875 [Bdellovibrionota bacterium]